MTSEVDGDVGDCGTVSSSLLLECDLLLLLLLLLHREDLAIDALLQGVLVLVVVLARVVDCCEVLAVAIFVALEPVQ